MTTNLNIDEEIAILEKYQMSPEELFIVRLIILAKEEDTNCYMLRFLRIPEDMRGDVHQILISLQNKGIITKSYKVPNKGEAFYPEDVTFNQLFIKTIYKASFDIGRELMEKYPPFTDIRGSLVPLKNISKKFDSLEDFYKFYGKTIKYNPEKHKEIMELLDWAVKNTNYLNFGILEFVISHKWEEIKLIKEGNISNMNFDAVTAL